jgi:hypothetical protein
MGKIFNKQNWPLILALAIPVLMIMGITLAIYVPGLFSKPQYNFLYMTGEGVSYYTYSDVNYYVRDGHLIQMPADSIPTNNYYYQKSKEVRFYLYNTSSNSSQELTFEEASKLKLDSATKSSDGYQIIRGGYGGDFLFSGGRSDYNSWFLQGHNLSKKLDLKLVGTYYYDNFKFLGWVN